MASHHGPAQRQVILEPVSFKLYFKEGGVGTFLPLFFELLQRHRVSQQNRVPGTVYLHISTTLSEIIGCKTSPLPLCLNNCQPRMSRT